MATAHFGGDDQVLLIVSLILTVATHFLNRRSRSIVDRAMAPLCIPERMRRGYDAHQLSAFIAKATSCSTDRGRTILDLYRGKVLSMDLGFAVGLCLFSALVWSLVTPHLPAYPLFTWVGWTASLLYLCLDVAEDIALIRLLRADRQVGRMETSIASIFTIGKIITITVSLFGLAVFLLLAGVDRILEQYD
ncbi:MULTISPECIES: hypothetical protein [unclassified Bradyrhizobium]|uniref:hypothetical protein n=1 Tax=unclassified Bradyrhizobium TaxID=2631580 RepID=UPI0028E8924C|nr:MULTISPECIES: hypothetical protein [unclassified Bradyrhizobium]